MCVDSLIERLEAKGYKVTMTGSGRTSRLYVDGVFYGIVINDRVYRQGSL